ncbi:MAG: hypothetical protein IPI21_12780 [Propionivibrio sp.]|nr:hypothetical protein [Propionivibrio sp.]
MVADEKNLPLAQPNRQTLPVRASAMATRGLAILDGNGGRALIGERQLIFPLDKVYGKLDLVGQTSSEQLEHSSPIDAKGTISFPSGVFASLMVDKSVDDFRFFVGCDPCSALREIDFRFAKINDDGLRHVATLTSLNGLNLRCSLISDAGLLHFKTMASLTFLELMWTGVGDKGVFQLDRLDQLQTLNLGSTAVTDLCLGFIGQFASLEHLHLWSTQVSDSGLRQLSSMRRLKTLSLHRTNLTDAGMEFLFGIQSLKYLNLEGTRVSALMKNRIRQALPGCSVL